MSNLISNEKIKFLSVGLISTATHFVVFFLCYIVLSRSLVVATVIGFCASLMVAYCLNYYFTFLSNQHHIESGTKYLLTTLIGLTWNIGLMMLFVEILHFHYAIAFLLMSVVVMINNYLFSKYWVF